MEGRGVQSVWQSRDSEGVQAALGFGLSRRDGSTSPSHTFPQEIEDRSLSRGKRFDAAEAVRSHPIVLQALRSPGDQLDPATRTHMQAQLGYDFSRVRVHADPVAALSASAVMARAYTVGRDVVFAAGRYEPTTAAGQELIAHELHHVIEQKSLGRLVLQRREDPGAPRAPAGATPPPSGITSSATGRPSPDTRTRKQVYVVDFGVNRDAVNWREVISHVGEIEAQSVDQMVRDVKADVGDPTANCLSKLTLDGHGSPGSMSVGDGTGWVEGSYIGAGPLRPSLAGLTAYFCDGAEVVILGCNVGRGATGARFIQTLADHWQVNVAAATGEVNGFGIMGVWVWGLPGQVLPGDAALIVDQIDRILDETTYGDDEEMILDLLEDSHASGLLADVKAQLSRQGRWNSLKEDLRDEDRGRFDRLFPGGS